jgi:hypothetical protein
VSRRVYLAGEGTTDIGGLAYEPPYRTSVEGFLQPILRKFADSEIDFEGGTLVRLARERVKKLSDALEKKAAAAGALAEYYGAEAIVFVTDVDVTPGKKASVHEADTRMASLRHSIAVGLDASGSVLPRAIGTPCRTIEAWALGDLDSVCDAADLDVTPSIPKVPEELWGKPGEPSSNHPKCVLSRIFGRDLDPGDYAAVADCADVGVIEANCPRSFASFRSEAEAALC